MKHKSMFVALAFLLAAGASLGAEGSAPARLTLKEAAQLALAKNPGLQSAALSVEAAGAQRDQARSMYRPRFDFQETFTNGNNPVYVFGSLLGQKSFTMANFALDALNEPDPLNNFKSELTVYQSIWEGGKVQARNRLADLNVQLKEHQLAEKRQNLLAEGGRHYYAIGLGAAGLATVESARRSAEANLEKVRNMYQAGLVVQADLLRLQVFLADIERQKLEAENQLLLSRLALDTDLGNALGTVFETSTPLALPDPDPASGAAYEALAQEKRPELLQLRQAVAMGQQQVQEAKGDYRPSVGLFSTLEYNLGTQSGAHGGNYLLGVQLRWNIYDGQQKGARVAEARASTAATEAQLRQVQNLIALQVREAYLRMQTARQQHQVAATAVGQAEEGLRIVKNRYEAGLATLTDLLDAETALTRARNNESGAVYGVNLARVNLALACGTLESDHPIFQ